MNDGGGSALDVHIGFFPPNRGDEIDQLDERGRRAVGGHERRPSLTTEPIDWAARGFTPRWLGDDSSGSVAALEPSLFANRGADEWRRFLSGTKSRGELALAVSMIGSLVEPEVSSLYGPSASVYLPGAAMGFASVGGPRIALAVAPTPCDGLRGADRDLALRVVNGRDQSLPWWALGLHGSEAHYGGGAGVQILSPVGAIEPILTSGAGEVVAAVWNSPDEKIRHYIIPWLPSWLPILQWLAQRAIPEFVPAAARRVHARVGDEPALQTTAEAVAARSLLELDEQYQARRSVLQAEFDQARSRADAVRHDLVFGSGSALETAVGQVLSDAEIQVEPLDKSLGGTASADLLVSYGGLKRLVEVKSASGNSTEQLVSSAMRHQATWPQLRPGVEIAGVTLVVNHQNGMHPLERSKSVYGRAEFVNSLTIPVLSTMQLLDAWRVGDLGAVRDMIFPPISVVSDSTAQGDDSPEERRTRPPREPRRIFHRRR